MINLPSQLVPHRQETDERSAILFSRSVETARKNNVR